MLDDLLRVARTLGVLVAFHDDVTLRQSRRVDVAAAVSRQFDALTS